MDLASIRKLNEFWQGLADKKRPAAARRRKASDKSPFAIGVRETGASLEWKRSRRRISKRSASS